MLDQRDYMRERRGGHQIGCLFGPGAVGTILLFTISAFVLQSFNPEMISNLSLVSQDVFDGQIYRCFTYMLLHGGMGHIFFNMWGLYLFGNILEQRIGTQRFYMLYLISGLSGAALWLIFNRYSIAPCIGASGAVFGIMVATALFYPDMRIMLLFPPIPMKMKTFAFAYAAIEIFLEFGGGDGNVAHIVHLGGFIGGYAYVKILYGSHVWGIGSLFKKKPKHALYDRDQYILFPNPEKVSQEELDRLLDKISADGINSLSDDEMDTLRRAREEMNRH